MHVYFAAKCKNRYHRSLCFRTITAKIEYSMKYIFAVWKCYDGICTLNGTNTNWLLLINYLNSNRYTDNECSNNTNINKHLTSIAGSLKKLWVTWEKTRCYLWRLLDSHRSLCNTLKQQEYLLTVLWLAYKFFSARNIHLSDV